MKNEVYNEQEGYAQERDTSVPPVIDLLYAGAFDESIVGGKAKNLGKLAAAGIRVPHGYVIPITGNNDDETIVHGIAEYKRKSLIDVAVRSSGNVEDQQEQGGYRGIFETQYLTAPSDELLAETILAIKHSGGAARAEAFRERHDIEGEFHVAVIVQDLVHAKYAGVAMIGETDMPVYTEVVSGMGMMLVDGAITPSAYSLQDGNVQIKRDGINLAHEQLIQVEQVGRKIVGELYDGKPQEIEYCFNDEGELFILQARPLPEEVSRKPEGIPIEEAVAHMTEHLSLLAKVSQRGEVVLSDSNIAENLGVRPAMLSADIFGYIFAGSSINGIPGAIQVGRNEMGYDCDPQSYGLWGIETTIGGKPYFDLVKDAHTFRMRGFSLGDYDTLIDGYIEQVKEDPKKAQYPETGLYRQVFTNDELIDLYGKETGDTYFGIQQAFLDNIRTLEGTFATEYDLRKEEIDDYLAESAIDVSTVSDEALLAHLSKHLEMLRSEICVDFVKAARLGFFAYDRVRSYLETNQDVLLTQEGQVDRLALQITSNPLGEPYGNPQTEKTFRLAAIKRGEATVEEFISEFGHEGVTELDIKRPRFRDSPHMLDANIQSVDEDMEQRVAEQEKERITVTDELITTLQKQERAGLDEFLQDIDSARLYLVFRERIKYDYLKVYEYMRKNLVELGDRYELGDQIFDLTIEEIIALPEQASEVKNLLMKRNAVLATTRGMYKPGRLFSDQEENNFTKSIQESNNLEASNVLGTSIVTGIVQRVLDPYGVTLERQEEMPVVVVTESTDPGWTAFLGGLQKGDALVTEIGGALSHEAVAAAGFGFTVAYGVDGATTLLRDGQLVQIDPHTNILTIISDHEPTEKRKL